MLQRPKIHHLKALNVDKIILEGQSHSTIRDSSGALFVKSVLFRKKGHGKSLMLSRPCPSSYFMFKLNLLKNYKWNKDPHYLILKVWLWKI